MCYNTSMKVLIFTTSEYPIDDNLDRLLVLLDEQLVQYELLDTVQAENTPTQELYDIMAVPAVVVCLDDGSAVKIWTKQLPSVDDLTALLGGSA